MGTTLTGTTPQDTYDSLIKVTDNGPISATAKFLSDGLGNDSALALSTARVGVGTASPTGKLQVTTDRFNDSLTFNAAAGLIIGGSIRQLAINSNDTAPFDMSMQAKTNGSTASNLILQPLGGSVGIGTSAPANLLDIQSTSATLRIRNTTAAPNAGTISKIVFEGINDFSGNSQTFINSIQAGNSGVTQLAFGTSSTGDATATERFRVTNNGVTFNGDTAAANALDDYEEGTFTPTLTLGSGSVTYTTQTGTYTKIGRLVTVQIRIVVNVATTPSGTVELTSLPFTISANAKGSISIWASGMAATSKVWVGEPTASSTALRIYTYDAGTVANTAVDLQNGCLLNITASYEV